MCYLGTYLYFSTNFYGFMYNIYIFWMYELYVGVKVGIRAGRILDLAMKYYKYFFPFIWVVSSLFVVLYLWY